MNNLLISLTVVGGHFSNRRRWKGIIYTLAFLLLPIAVFIVGAVALSVFEEAPPLSKLVIPGIFILGVVTLWWLSARQAIHDRSQALAPRYTDVVATILATTIVYAAVFYGVIALVVAPQITPGKHIDLFGWNGSKVSATRFAKTMNQGEGDVVLKGTVLVHDEPLPNARVVLLFENDVRSQTIVANASGNFEFRLPPGEWRFLGPMIEGRPLSGISVILRPNMLEPIFRVGAGPVRTSIETKVLVAK